MQTRPGCRSRAVPSGGIGTCGGPRCGYRHPGQLAPGLPQPGNDLRADRLPPPRRRAGQPALAGPRPGDRPRPLLTRVPRMRISIVCFPAEPERRPGGGGARSTSSDCRDTRRSSWCRSSAGPANRGADPAPAGPASGGLSAEGRRWDSEGLARRLQQMMNQGCSHLVLVIGGPDGLPARAAAQAQECWSLSPLTFSHQLARLLLLEVLYRSFDLLHGGRYHK